MTIRANLSAERLAVDAVTVHGAVQKVSELAGLLRYLAICDLSRVLEIGVKDGGTLWLWRQLAAEVIGIDIEPHAPTMQGVTVIEGDSRDVQVDGRFDLVFIDGDHTYEGTMHDWLTFGARAPLVAFHDIVPYGSSRGVDRLWGEIKKTHNTLEWVDPGHHEVNGETLTERDGGIGLVIK